MIQPNTFFLWLSLLFPAGLLAQTVVPVAPDQPGNAPGALNDAIEAYQADNGDPDLDVIFELQSGGLYVLRATLDYEFPLRIEAEEGYTTRPIIRPGVPQGGGDGFRAFRVRDDLILRGLYLTNEDPAGGVEDQIVRISQENARIILEDCHLDRASQSAFRLDNLGNRLFIRDCIISNIFNLANPSNGRGIDDRGNDIDTLVVENSTFYNLSSRLLRDDGGVINYIKWVHTTCVNTGDRTLEMGEAIEVEVRDNLFHNYGFLGDGSPGSSSFRIDSVDASVQANVIIRNLNFSYDSAAFTAALDSINAVATTDPDLDSVYYRASTSGDTKFFIEREGFDSTITFFDVEFVNAPTPPSAYLASFNLDPDNLVSFDRGNGGAGPGQVQLPFDFGYTAVANVTEGAVDGGALGDPRWMATTTSVTPRLDLTTGLRAFPNPFREGLNLRYELLAPAAVRGQVVDLMGRSLLRFDWGWQAAGTQTGRLSPAALQGLPAGHYSLQLQAGEQLISTRLVKLP